MNRVERLANGNKRATTKKMATKIPTKKFRETDGKKETQKTIQRGRNSDGELVMKE